MTEQVSPPRANNYVFNGTVWVPQRVALGASNTLVTGTGVLADATMLWDDSAVAFLSAKSSRGAGPTAEVGAYTLPVTNRGYNGANYDVERLAKPDGSSPGTVGIPADAILLWHAGLGQYVTVSAANSLPDAYDGAKVQGAANMAYNTASGLWDRLRSSAPVETKANPTVALDVNAHLLGISSGSWYRVAVASDSDANAAGPIGVVSAARAAAFNDTTWDRTRNNTQGALLASAARTVSTASAFQTNYNAKGVLIYLDVTAVGTGSLGIHIYGVHPVINDTPNPLAVSAAVTTSGRKHAFFYPGVGAVTVGTLGTSVILSAPLVLPRQWSAVVTHTDGSSWTYSLAYAYIL